jgi:hypothetical protein
MRPVWRDSPWTRETEKTQTVESTLTDIFYKHRVLDLLYNI